LHYQRGIKIKKRKGKIMVGKMCIVRTYSSGVFFGKLKSRKGKEVVLSQAIRLWKWAGAASLSQLAMEGTKLPGECKFAMPVDAVLLIESIEIIPASKAGIKSILEVKSWKI